MSPLFFFMCIMRKKLLITVIVFVAGAAAWMFLPRFCPFMCPQAEVITRTDLLYLYYAIR